MKYITNPILPGFNADPSILRVDDDYYIATSTFEWFPGVQIHHSKDLVNWELIAHPLNRTSQLNMKGNSDSGGIWAPCLSWDNGTFYLIYTDVKNHDEGIFDDTHNYLVTTDNITGDWSEPIYLNSSGFDPSLFHDDDGKKWLLNMIWDFRPWKNSFAGIALQEYSVKEQKLVGSIKNIFRGTELGATEAPHVYKKNGYYYLMTAEGGTVWDHAVSVARSRKLDGPYEVDPQNPIVTSKDDSTLQLQKAGHASIVETKAGECYLVHLTGRPLPSRGVCVLGRETAIQKMKWSEDGWLRLENGTNKPEILVPAPDLPEFTIPVQSEKTLFDGELNINFQTLRVPLGEENLSLKERPGYLRLKGAESLGSLHTQALVARRQQSFIYEASTSVEFSPENFQQMAGLVYYYDSKNYIYIYISEDEEEGKSLNIMNCNNSKSAFSFTKPIAISTDSAVELKVDVRYEKAQFYFRTNSEQWNSIGNEFDIAHLSDEYFLNIDILKFTGAFVGVCCQDLSGQKIPADFKYFEYREKGNE